VTETPDSAEPRPKVAAPAHPRRAAGVLGISSLVVLGVLAGWGFRLHAERHAAAETSWEATQSAVPIVRVMRLPAFSGADAVELPGTMEPYDAASLFARSTGYISQRNVDIGSQVKKGQVLAVIAAPDLDEQLSQARAKLIRLSAALAEARAQGALAAATDRRTARLVTEGWSSGQQGDNDRLTLSARDASIAAAEANLIAQQANVDRLAKLTGFESVVAPFNGLISARHIDVGSLVTADVGSGTPLFSIVQTDVLRVQVFVPQEVVFQIKNGQHAVVTVPGLPGRRFDGIVARNAAALSTATRTLLTEVDVNNSSGLLTGGLYCVVHFELPRDQTTVQIPSEAVIFTGSGLTAAVYKDGRVELRSLDIKYDNGADLEVQGGLQPGDQLILDPPLNVIDGMKVRAVQES
jgi:RND family efflux transporter MFP subunit